jgi:hypothetical protein
MSDAGANLLAASLNLSPELQLSAFRNLALTEAGLTLLEQRFASVYPRPWL